MSREKAVSILDDPVQPSQRSALGISRVLYSAGRKFCSGGGEGWGFGEEMWNHGMRRNRGYKFGGYSY